MQTLIPKIKLGGGIVLCSGILAHQVYNEFDETIRLNKFLIRRFVDFRSLIFWKNENYVNLRPQKSIFGEKYETKFLSELLRDNGYGVGDFAQIKDLDASSCGLEYIDINNIKLKNLQVLNLSYNKINFFTWFGRSLKEINLAYNTLSQKDFIIGCENLKRLNISQNKFTQFPTWDITYRKKLKYINIKYNDIPEKEISAFIRANTDVIIEKELKN